MEEGGAVAVHRCRFVDFNPSAISALVFSPLPLPSALKSEKAESSRTKPQKFGTLAVGRANGSIDLCEWTGAGHQQTSPQAWVVRQVQTLFLRGSTDIKLL
jgi:U3 small nucleolar RNA-associated protein 4